jgi:hypothetical protein
MRRQHFTYDFDVVNVTDHYDDDREIAGNAMAPKCALTFRATAETG